MAVTENNVKALKQFSWRDAANLMYVAAALPLLLLAALRGELARRLKKSPGKVSNLASSAGRSNRDFRGSVAKH